MTRTGTTSSTCTVRACVASARSPARRREGARSPEPLVCAQQATQLRPTHLNPGHRGAASREGGPCRRSTRSCWAEWASRAAVQQSGSGRDCRGRLWPSPPGPPATSRGRPGPQVQTQHTRLLSPCWPCWRPAVRPAGRAFGPPRAALPAVRQQSQEAGAPARPAIPPSWLHSSLREAWRRPGRGPGRAGTKTEAPAWPICQPGGAFIIDGGSVCAARLCSPPG